MNFIGKIIIAIALSISSLFNLHQQPQNFGATGGIVQTTQFYLSGAGVNATQNTISLTSFTTPDGRALTISMFQGGIIYGDFEPGTSKLEDFTANGITQNANGTATLTGVTRGNDFIAPYLASTTLAKAHAGGATLILTNTAGFYGNNFLPSNLIATSTATLVFSSTTPPHYDFNPNFASFPSTTFASAGYVNSSAAAGAVPITNTNAGIGILATALQQASSTPTQIFNAVTYNLVTASANATDTPTSGCGVGFTGTAGAACSVIADLTGHVWKNVIGNLSLANTWSALNTFNGAVTIIANAANKLTLGGSATTWNLSNVASSTLLESDGSGNLSLESTYPHQYTITNATGMTATNGTNKGFATSTPFMVIPAGFMTASSTIRVTGAFSCNSQSTNLDSGDILLRDSLGDTLGDVPCTTNATFGNIAGTFEIDLSFSSSVSNETTLNVNGGIFLTVSASTITSDSASTVTTNTINLGNAFSVGLVASAQSGGGTPQTIISAFNIVATK